MELLIYFFTLAFLYRFRDRPVTVLSNPIPFPSLDVLHHPTFLNIVKLYIGYTLKNFKGRLKTLNTLKRLGMGGDGVQKNGDG